jgi:hypothetical protein
MAASPTGGAAPLSSFVRTNFMLQHDPVRACVAPSAIAKVTRMFSGSLGDILAELFQNARRAGARTIAVTGMKAPSFRILIVDDGSGISSPQSLLSLGESAWQAAHTVREDPAGMGFFSLAGRAITITSSTGDDGFRLTIPTDGWTGEKTIAVETTAHPRGTSIVFEASEQWLRDLRREVERAARHFPIEVTLDGTPQKRTPFLEGAVHRKREGGIEIGVFARQFYTNEPNINFHGLTLHHRLPTVIETDYSHWSARIDIIDAPKLHLVLPARKELVENAQSIALDGLVRAAIFEAIRDRCRDGGHHALSKRQWDDAAALGILLPEAQARLRQWQPETAEEHGSAGCAARCDPSDNALLIPAFEPCEAQMLARACELARDNPLGQMLCAKPAYEGYGWYDALAHVTGMDASVQSDGATLSAEAIAALSTNTTRVDFVLLDISLRSGLQKFLSLDLYLASDPDDYGYPDELTVLVTRDSPLSPPSLADIITDCGFSPSDDVEAGSYQDQRDYYERKALHRAFELLGVGDECDLAKIRNDFIEFVSWLVPKGRTLSLHYDGSGCQAKLGEPLLNADGQA